MLLYGHDESPFTFRVRVAALELQIELERNTHGWAKDPSPEFEAHAPTKRVPMLDRGPGAKVRYVFESAVIAGLFYGLGNPLPDAQGTMFLPALEQLDQNLLGVLDNGLSAAINIFLLEKDGILRDQSAYLKRQAARVLECLDWAETQYAHQGPLKGKWAYVDIAAVATMRWMRMRQYISTERWPNLLALEALAGKRASFIACGL